MPISPLTIQRRHAELGRIRLGAKANGNGRPMKLETFRFTSVSERYIRDLAELYGGEARPWDNGGIASWEVFTDARTIPVIAVKGGLSQWMETWSGGGVVHRCDGERDVEGNLCDPNDRAHQNAKPTTRLSLMLPELEAIGAWRLESHGWNAAAEIPAVAELAQYVGDLVPAHLNLVERRAIKDGKTSRFVVPVLDLQIGTARLREIVAEKSGLAEITGPATGQQPAALPSSSTPAAGQGPQGAMVDDAYTPYFERLGEQETLDALQTLWEEAVAAKLVGQAAPTNPLASPTRVAEFTAEFRRYAQDIKAQQEATADPDGAVEAELVPEPDSPPAAQGDEDADAIWQQILAAAGRIGMTTPDLEQHFAETMGGLSSATANAGELRHYLTQLETGHAA